MRTYSTKMQVLNQETKELVWVGGMKVIAHSEQHAQQILDRHDYHYLALDGELIAEIPCIKGTYQPDWGGMIEYNPINEN